MINQYEFEIGFLGKGYPFVRVGKYRPPIVVLPGLTMDYRPPSWLVMNSYARGLHRLSSARTVSVVQRRRGLPAATSLRDLADETVQGLDRPGAGRPLVVVVPAILEELGWRGFGVQSAVEQGRSPAWAALAVGKLFLALHIHLYLPSQRYAGLPFWLLPLTRLASLVLLTWIYLRTRSVLITGLMHAAFNATVPLTWGLPAGWVWEARAIILILIAALVVGRVGITWWRSPLPAAEEARHDYVR